MRMAQTDDRYKHIFNNLEGDRYNQHHLHKMHIKLLAVRNLEESMQKIVSKRRKDTLEHLMFVTRGYVN